jgi:glycosyltransferase involved in cell wall biosynthesis
MLQESVRENPRVEFKGTPNDDSVCEWLRRTKVFVSGNCTEGLGVTYLEALSQGCVVAMPASGGGVELALGQLGSSVHLLPLSLDRSGVLDVLRRAASSDYSPMQFTAYAPESVAATYLDLDSGRSSLAPQTLPNRTKTVSLS